MIVGLLGRALRAIGRWTGGERGRARVHLGDELVRLDSRPRQPATSR